MEGIYVKKKVLPEQFKMILDAEFIDLKIEIENQCSDTIRLYPMKTIRKYDL